MAWDLIASGTSGDVSTIPDFEAQVDEGQRARLEFRFAVPIPTFQVDALRDSLTLAGVNELQVAGSGDTIDIYYRKDPWWVPVIIVAVLALAILIISWLFFKEVVKTTGPVGGTLFIVGGVVLSFALAYSLFRR